MYWLPVGQQISTVKVLTFFKRLSTHVRVIRAYETEITSAHTFDGNYFSTEDNHESNNDKNNLLLGIFEDLRHAL